MTIHALVGRTSDRIPVGAEGAAALAAELAARTGATVRTVGEPGIVPDGHWRDDLRDAAPILEAADPAALLLASDCSICIGSLPRLPEDVVVLWLDAHADCNTPETTTSQFLGGMCLAGACGLWDTGWGAIDPERVVIFGARDVEPAEQEVVDEGGIRVVERPSEVAAAVAGRRVFVHLDLDVLDPSVLPGALFPVPGGLSDGGLRTLLAEVAEAAESIAGLEVTSMSAPGLAPRVATILAPLLPA